MSMSRMILCLTLLIFIGCSEKPEMNRAYANDFSVDPEKNRDPKLVQDTENAGKSFASKTENGITYSIDLISAVEFVSRKGEQIEMADRMELMKETVAILTIDLNNEKESDVFESEKITMDKEDAMNYLVGKITSDIEIEQHGKVISPSGAEYDAGISKPSQLRIFIYFDNVKINQPSNVMIYDRLFGSGLLRFNIQ